MDFIGGLQDCQYLSDRCSILIGCPVISPHLKDLRIQSAWQELIEDLLELKGDPYTVKH